MRQRTKIYNRFDVVVVPFPFTDSSITKRRPALIISASQQEPLAYRFGGDERNASEARIPSAHLPRALLVGLWADG